MSNSYDSNLTPEEKWEKATIANNFIFYKIMRNNPDVCKGIRLDVYAKNARQAFNLEMQATDTKELPERTRYYQGSIDVDCLNSGQKYKDLKDSYVIFICIPDLFEKGLACYSFENLCREDTEIRLNDRTYKYFFIASNCDKILNEKQKAFLKVVVGQKASDSFSKKLEELTEEAKHNTQWRHQYMEWERQRTYDFEDGKEAGIKLGIEAKAKEDAKAFYKNGVSKELITKSLNITLEELEEILKEC